MQTIKARLGNKIWLLPIIILAMLFFIWKHHAKPTPTLVETASENGETVHDKQNAALTVQIIKPAITKLDSTIEANGNIQPWQEAIIGAEVSGLLMKEVLVNVGDVVKKGQTLARFSSATIEPQLAQTIAALAEAKANLIEAANNAERARSIKDLGALSGALSRQQIDQYVSAEAVAKARMEAAEANVAVQKIKLNQTTVMALDDGIISSRTATVGAVATSGQELFRLIRQGRLEWRADITSADISHIKPNSNASITLPSGDKVSGHVRVIAPAIDKQTRNGLVYVDLSSNKNNINSIKAGMFARGSFIVAESKAITLPASTIVLREGFAYLMQVDANNHIKQVKVNLGRRNGDRVEITSFKDNTKALAQNFVAAGGTFLADGDLVRVVADQSVNGEPAKRQQIKQAE